MVWPVPSRRSFGDRDGSGRVVVIGAGWAGMAAAWELLCAKDARGGQARLREVWVLERAPHPGGRAFSFRDRSFGLELDNGQHVLLGCCAAMVQLLTALGLGDAVRFQDLLHIPVYAGGCWADLSSVRLPGPLHLARTLVRYRHLSRMDRARLVGMVRHLTRLDFRRWDHLSFADWLALHRQSDRAVERLWDLVGVAVLNGHAERVSAALALTSFRMGVLSGWQAARLGYFTIPLGDVAQGAVQALTRRGANVGFHQAVEEIVVESGRVCGVRVRKGMFIPAEAVVAAVPHDALYRLLPSGWQGHATFSGLARLSWSPILNVYLLYDRPVFRREVAAYCGGMLQFVFNRGRLLGNPDLDGRLLSVSLSAADALRGIQGDEIVRQVDQELRQAHPREMADVRLLHAFPVWQPRATFLAAPGTWGLRPSPVSPIAGLFLAGDWTDTGWPACLEGAVRSGQAAARSLLRWRGSAPESAGQDGAAHP
ncbi:phytoene dehydrogenase [Alicyclobacillus cellulosilyticus]|uniref:Phytoene dehydrogenase n=1 Tax=Alicyclobacillus cellulosilyticus TaxID=1003997 RepID=A0A917K2F6_9BACL|nr:hydroxysqualene dehydroxylase HpnE [Alicyclobacillus cellulosilyticus]GGI98280.1 phytoene dehydrogenase [Alicyclobacillus cellulosilyticus]